MARSGFISTRLLFQQEYSNWHSTDISNVNGNTVRFRLMKQITTKWHCHPESDELFIVQRGEIKIETSEEISFLSAGDIFRVKAGVRHHVVVEDEVALLIIDAIKNAHRNSVIERIYKRLLELFKRKIL